ncbi:MAG: acyl carrier protein [Eubacteriales bacterium]|nr:acyl carrier protein [Sarcina sp.]MBR2728877.1 acyl carrier protein [Lachnospiraceae bacterium]MDO4416854.1 acyl carrier protein [Eubacteriales bacterium]
MLLDKIAELISERTGCGAGAVRMDSTFKDLNIDSLDRVDLLMDLEDYTGVQIELSEKVETVGDLIRIIEEKKKDAGKGEETENAN